ncbi:BatD family protein [Vibrio sp. 404]|uniref:BatD family protein n=1 Tax=Vibrio marinisediminis TaxID=2758441 RepID=A0A7W2FUB3_9VIBR|nr:BatD family protein [Vibrio marinisediminis]MBA5764388.1 BatD family protein [Vibrio marinisediminis]
MVMTQYRTLSTLILIGCWLLSLPAYAANLTATVSSNQVTKAEVFQLRVIYDEKVDSNSLDFSVLEPSFFLGQPSYSSALNFVNGKRSSRSEWTIALKPKNLGTLKIPAFTVEGSSSSPISIQVSQDTDLPDQDDLAVIQSQLVKAELYPNETTQLKTRLIIKTNPRRLQNVQILPPKNAELTIEESGQANQYQSVVNGIEATIVDQTFTITAQHSGSFVLNSVGFEATFVLGDNRTGTTKLLPIQIAPEQFTIDVSEKPQTTNDNWLPTPQLLLSQTWFDAQGKELSAIDQPTLIALGDSITRELSVNIQGIKAENFPDLSISYPDSVRQYAEKPRFETLDDGSTQMTVKQVLIAQRTGKTLLPAVSIEWFNTLTTDFQTSQLDGIELMVEPASEALNIPLQPTITAAPNNNEQGFQFWPYLTALFAILWLATLTWHMKTRHKLDVPKAEPKNNELESLLNAISNNEIAQTQYFAKLWLTHNRDKDPTIAKQIDHELQQMVSSQFGGNHVEWNNKTLRQLIKKLSRCRSTNENSATLSKL